MTRQREDDLSTTSTSLDQVPVADVMRNGTLTCQSETPLPTVARLMSEHRVHSVVVTHLDGVSESAWGIVTDVDLLRAVGARWTSCRPAKRRAPRC